ncbi:MAG: glycosyltransferase family 4 protein [Anaerocolumna sp.]
MKRALLVAHVASMIDLFNRDNIRLLQEKGYHVDIACNFNSGNVTSSKRIQKFKEEFERMNIRIYQVPFPRKITALDDIFNSYKILKKILIDSDYKVVHCQSPIASVLTRLVCKVVKKDMKLLYMAHGFHFYKGASILNWIFYYNIEKYCAKYTNTILTINKEDYYLANTKFTKTNSIQYVPGVGIDIEKIRDIKTNKPNKLSELDIPNDATILISVGELNKNKNHQVAIKALAKLKKDNLYYIICGIGPMQPKLHRMIKKYHLSENIRIMGYREDIIELLKISDIFMFPSIREGLSLSLMEAMATGLPILCSNIRGNVDLIRNGEGGYLFQYNDVVALSNHIEQLSDNLELREKMGQTNLINIKDKDINRIHEIMSNIYDALEDEYDNTGDK